MKTSKRYEGQLLAELFVIVLVFGVLSGLVVFAIGAVARGYPRPGIVDRVRRFAPSARTAWS